MAGASCGLGNLSASWSAGQPPRGRTLAHHWMAASRSNIGHATIRMVSNFHLDPPFGGSFQAPTLKCQHPGDTEVSHHSSPILPPEGGFWCRQVASGEDFGELRWSPVQPCFQDSNSQLRTQNSRFQILNVRFQIANLELQIANSGP